MHGSKVLYPVYLNATLSREVHAALLNNGHRNLAQKIEEQVSCSRAHVHYAENLCRFSGEDLDLDDEPVIAPGEDGAYVLHWHWVRTSDLQTG